MPQRRAKPANTRGSSAKQWATMLTELRNRGLQDALIVCCDGLKGLPESIRLTWPDATVQTCVVHLVRNSLRYASKKHWGQITRELREIYTAPTVEAAEVRFGAFAETWRAWLALNRHHGDGSRGGAGRGADSILMPFHQSGTRLPPATV